MIFQAKIKNACFLELNSTCALGGGYLTRIFWQIFGVICRLNHENSSRIAEVIQRKSILDYTRYQSGLNWMCSWDKKLEVEVFSIDPISDFPVVFRGNGKSLIATVILWQYIILMCVTKEFSGVSDNKDILSSNKEI